MSSIRTSDQTKEIFEALIKFQSEVGVAQKSSFNGFTGKNYADLESIVSAARGPLAKNGLGFWQLPVNSGTQLVLVTRILHVSGQWIEGETPMTAVKEDPQSMGALISYYKRYALQAFLGIVSSLEDDDGETAMGRAKTKTSLPSSQQQDFDLASKDDVTRLMKAFQGVNVNQAMILKYLKKSSLNQMTVQELDELRDIGNSIQQGREKIEKFFDRSAK